METVGEDQLDRNIRNEELLREDWRRKTPQFTVTKRKTKEIDR